MFNDTEGITPMPVWSMQHPYVPDGETFTMPGGIRLDMVYHTMGCSVKRVMDYHRPSRDMEFGIDGYIMDPRRHDQGDFTVDRSNIIFGETSLRSYCNLVNAVLNYDYGSSVMKSFKIENFMFYRYHVMNRSYPHNVFGTNRADNNFFDETLRLLSYPKALKDELRIAVKDQHTYEIEYLKWVKTHSDIELSMQYVKP